MVGGKYYVVVHVPNSLSFNYRVGREECDIHGCRTALVYLVKQYVRSEKEEAEKCTWNEKETTEVCVIKKRLPWNLIVPIQEIINLLGYIEMLRNGLGSMSIEYENASERAYETTLMEWIEKYSREPKEKNYEVIGEGDWGNEDDILLQAYENLMTKIFNELKKRGITRIELKEDEWLFDKLKKMLPEFKEEIELAFKIAKVLWLEDDLIPEDIGVEIVYT